MKPTIQDVARLAGVSPSTVSRVINNSAPISDPTKQRVYEAMEMLNYEMNVVASSLRSKRTNVIGVVISDNANPLFAKMVSGISTVAGEAGYHVILCNTNNVPETEQQHVRVLLQRQVDGLIISVARESGRQLNALRELDIPLVYVNRRPLDVQGIAVVADNAGAVRLAVDHLVEYGHRRIAYIYGDLSYSTGKERLRGYEEALMSCGVPLDPSLVMPGNFREDDSERSTLEVLQRPDPPSSIIASDVYGTMGILRAIRKLGLEIPRDISVVGFDNPEWTELLTPPLTVLAQPTVQLGMTAAEELLGRIETKDENTSGLKEISLPCQLVKRDSVRSLL